MAVMHLYRIRGFRYWIITRQSDIIRAEFSDSTGKVLREVVVNSNLPSEYCKAEVKSPDGKPVTVKVDFQNDCWGGVAADTPLKLSADRWFGARNSDSAPVGIWLKAPKAGSLAIEWRWRRGTNIEAGNGLGVQLENAEGKCIARANYTIPAFYESDDETCRYSMKLEIPPEYRGRKIRMFISDPKWISWRIHGLDYPWLGNRESDL